MKKLLQILGVILLFSFLVSSCGGDKDSDDKAKNEQKECVADCKKSCCLGCKATEGKDKTCLDPMTCCEEEESEGECCGGESEDCCSSGEHSHGEKTHSHTDAEEGHSHARDCCGGESEDCCSSGEHSGGEETNSHTDAKEGKSHDVSDSVCCCGDENCNGSCHEEEVEEFEPPGGNWERYMDLKESGLSHEEIIKKMEEEY